MTIKVPGQPPSGLPARLVFVAEAPSDEEEEQGRPLCGPSGRVFNSLLRSAGIDRAECGVTNVFDEKLPGNDVSKWCVGLAEARSLGLTDLPPIGRVGFLRAEHRGHLARLAEEIARWRPTVIVPLGGTALWAFTGQSGITAMRGVPAAATHCAPGVKIVPTFHPAAVMRQYKLFAVAVGDLIKASEEADHGPEVRRPHRELLLEPTLADLDEWKPRLLDADLLSVDIETFRGQITSIGFAPSATAAICIPFLDPRVANRSYWPTADDELAAWKFVREVLASPVPKLGQNFGGFDANVLLSVMRMPVRNFVQDTRLMQHALYPELPKGLEFMGNTYGTQGAWKQWGRKREKKDD